MKAIQGNEPVTRSTLNIRIRPDDRDLIDRAASASGLNRTDFVIGAAKNKAQEVLADVRVINVEPDVYDSFIKALDEPPQPNAALIKTMQSKSPWEK